MTTRITIAEWEKALNNALANRPRLVCRQCGYVSGRRWGGNTWVKCPHCSTPFWNEPHRNYLWFKCGRCGHVFRQRGETLGHSPSRCPRCSRRSKCECLGETRPKV